MVENQRSGKLAVILHADISGSTALVQQDEHLAHERIQDAFRRFSKTIEKYQGRVCELRGDALLAEFERASDAAAAALTFQIDHNDHNAKLSGNIRPTIRVGIALGEVVIADNTVTGAGVVLAQRVEQLAEPGGVCITGAISEALPQRLPLEHEDLGEQQVKGFDKPVHVYRIKLSPGESIPPPQESSQLETSPRKWGLNVAVAVIVLVVAGGAAYWFKPWVPEATVIADAPSIAVLPFDNMSSDVGLDYFSDGITEDIITELSKNPDIKVIARNSSFTYKGKTVKAQQIGNELGVRYVLKGSVRKQGDKVRITAQLIDANSDLHVWADRFDEEGTDIFAIQDRITKRIDTTLGGHGGRIRETEYQRVWKMDAAKLEEYDYYLRGHSVFFGYTPEAMIESREIWQEGLRKFPGSGLLRIKIAWGYFQFFYQPWGFEREANLKRAYELLQEGLADKDLPLVGRWYGHWLNAFVQLHLKRNYDLALEEAMKTIEMAPNHSDALVDNAQILVYAGNPDLAIEWITRAINVEPYVPDWYYQNLGQAYFAKGNCQQAVKEGVKVDWVAVDRNTAMATCFVEIGQIDDAMAALKKLLEIQPDITASNLDRYLPYKNETILERMRIALAQLGLTE